MPTILPKTIGIHNLQNVLNSSLIGNSSLNSLANRGRGRPVGSYKNIAQALNARNNPCKFISIFNIIRIIFLYNKQYFELEIKNMAPVLST